MRFQNIRITKQRIGAGLWKNTASNLKTFPNPVATYTTFAFNLSQASDVEIIVGDLGGAQVKTVFSDKLSSGPNEIEVDLNGLQPGIYFYRVQLSNQKGSFIQSQKLVKI